MMNPSNDFFNKSELDYEGWRTLLRSLCGQYNPEGTEPQAFTGWVRPQTVCGFEAVDLACNAHRVERTHRDVRLDSMEHYYAAFQLGGQSKMAQNDHIAELAVGDVAIVDSTRPMTYFGENRPGRWLALHLPRQALISHLGSEPEGGLRRGGSTLAGRLLFQLVREAVRDRDTTPELVEPHMQLVIYDLLGALFAPSEPSTASTHTDKLFVRVCTIIKHRFADPDIGPCEVAAEAGISLRYLQKLFTVRGTTCSRYIHSLRLDHATHLLRRRALMKNGQPLVEIAYSCGFRDYTYFARTFRYRFGCPPGTSADLDRNTKPRAAPDFDE
jgi:AraC family transcriptional activator of tynA and feaB